MCSICRRQRLQKFTPCLWFDYQAEEAARFSASVCKNSRIKSVTRYGEAESQVSGKPPGSVLTVDFELDGQTFVALNGGPLFKFSPAISFMVNCETQAEIDALWEKLTRGGRESECGSLEEKFGISWQIVPTVLPKLLQDQDREKRERVMKALLSMRKLDKKGLTEA